MLYGHEIIDFHIEWRVAKLRMRGRDSRHRVSGGATTEITGQALQRSFSTLDEYDSAFFVRETLFRLQRARAYLPAQMMMMQGIQSCSCSCYVTALMLATW